MFVLLAVSVGVYYWSTPRVPRVRNVRNVDTHALHTETKTVSMKKTMATYPLTAREREIALLAMQGQSSTEIAGQLAISVRTVDKHLQNIYRKLNIRSRSELKYVLRDMDAVDM